MVRDSDGEKERTMREGMEGYREKQGWGRICGKDRSNM
jgi:hypothetical protein